jgi:hypothetical protein
MHARHGRRWQLIAVAVRQAGRAPASEVPCMRLDESLMHVCTDIYSLTRNHQPDTSMQGDRNAFESD